MAHQQERLLNEGEVVAAFERLKAELLRELEALVVDVRATPALAYLLFDLQPEAAFYSFPITTFMFDGEGQRLSGKPYDRLLLAGRVLLVTQTPFPLGRADWIGLDTTEELELIRRVCVAQLREAWHAVCGHLPGVRAAAGTWLSGLDSAPTPMLDLTTGEQLDLKFLWT